MGGNAMTALLLLLPLLLPLAAAFLARRRAEQRSLIALMGLELALVLLCLFCKGWDIFFSECNRLPYKCN